MEAESEVPEFEVFVYPAAPWTEPMAGVGGCMADLFPGSGEFNALDSSSEATHSNGAAANPMADARASSVAWPASSNLGDSWEGAQPLSMPRANSGPSPLGSTIPAQASPLQTSPGQTPVLSQQAWALRLAEESRRAEERGRSAGIESGLVQGKDEAAHHFHSERTQLLAQVNSLFESFAEARVDYFHRIERETVELSLAIAARILRREAQVDPLLLTGAVRVALGQLAETTSVRLRVPARDQSMWEEAVALMPRLALRPQVIADDRMQLGDCRVETEIGSADLGLWPQLKEIERGFFDRVQSDKDQLIASQTDGQTNSRSRGAVPAAPCEDGTHLASVGSQAGFRAGSQTGSQTGSQKEAPPEWEASSSCEEAADSRHTVTDPASDPIRQPVQDPGNQAAAVEFAL